MKVVTEALKKLGHPVDLASHFGFVQDWNLVGPFDNRQGKGFDNGLSAGNGRRSGGKLPDAGRHAFVGRRITPTTNTATSI